MIRCVYQNKFKTPQNALSYLGLRSLLKICPTPTPTVTPTPTLVLTLNLTLSLTLTLTSWMLMYEFRLLDRFLYSDYLISTTCFEIGIVCLLIFSLNKGHVTIFLNASNRAIFIKKIGTLQPIDKFFINHESRDVHIDRYFFVWFHCIFHGCKMSQTRARADYCRGKLPKLF